MWALKQKILHVAISYKLLMGKKKNSALLQENNNSYIKTTAIESSGKKS